MTPLRQRYRQDLQLRNYSSKTQQVYEECVSLFARHFGQSPERLGPEDIRTYQLYLALEKKASWSRFNQTVCALRFLYRHTLHKDWIIQHIPFSPKGESAASGLESRRGFPVSPSHSATEVSHVADYHLRHRLARVRGLRPAGKRHRQPQ